jgi:hypothetical protein
MVSAKRLKKPGKKGQAPRRLLRKNARGRGVSNCPNWLSTFSNKILPPMFFLFIAVLSLYYMPAASKTSLKLNLGVVSVAASSLSMYLAILML